MELNRTVFSLLIAFSLLGSFQNLHAQEDSQSDKLVVATKEIPPFVIKSDTGAWSGVSIDLWRTIAEKLELEFEFQEHTLESMLDGLESKTVDIAVGALTITPERDEVFDFTHSYFQSGIGIAIVSEPAASSWSRVAKSLLSRTFVDIICLLVLVVLVLVVLGVLIWYFERRRNPEQFGGNLLQGVGAGFWWSAVTMTTVGYGDKSPKSLAGRVIAVVWMFTSLFLLAFFTASVTSALTVAELDTGIDGPEDLPGRRVGCIREATGHDYLRERQIYYLTFETPRELLAALVNRQVDAAIHDAPVLRYLSKKELDDTISVLPRRLQLENYAFGLSEGSGLRESINRQLLREIESPHWQDTLNRYMSQ